MRVRAIAAVAIILALASAVVAVVTIGPALDSVPDPGRPGTSDAGSSETPASGGLDGESSSSRPQPHSLPPSAPLTQKPTAPQKPLVSKPLPKSASARGELVAGFPVAVIPLVPGGSVLFSSVAATGAKLQVGLESIASMAPADVIAHYSAAFSRLGLVAAPTPATGGARTATFTRGGNSVTVTAASYGGSNCRFTVFGVFSPGT
jgi:hypothetical protein